MNEYKIVHIRNVDKNGVPQARGGATLLYKEINGCMEWKVSYCRLEDNYNKKIGVEKALKSFPFKTDRQYVSLKEDVDKIVNYVQCAPSESYLFFGKQEERNSIKNQLKRANKRIEELKKENAVMLDWIAKAEYILSIYHKETS